MRRMSRMPRSARICAPVPYSRESAGKPSCKFASSVSTPCSCSAYACLRPGGTRTCLVRLPSASRLPPVCLPSASRLPLVSLSAPLSHLCPEADAAPLLPPQVQQDTTAVDLDRLQRLLELRPAIATQRPKHVPRAALRVHAHQRRRRARRLRREGTQFGGGDAGPAAGAADGAEDGSVLDEGDVLLAYAQRAA